MPTMSKKAKQMFILKGFTTLGDANSAEYIIGNVTGAADAISILAILNEHDAEKNLQQEISGSHGALSAEVADLRAELARADRANADFHAKAQYHATEANGQRSLAEVLQKKVDELGTKAHKDAILLDLLTAGKVWLDYGENEQRKRVDFFGISIEINAAKELMIFGKCELPNVAWRRSFTSAQIVDWKPYTD